MTTSEYLGPVVSLDVAQHRCRLLDAANRADRRDLIRQAGDSWDRLEASLRRLNLR